MAKKHLLIVDSDAKALRVMEVSLRKAGFSVTTANGGADALEKAKISPPELIVSDTAMPGMDGFTFCREVKKTAALAHVPFFFLSAEKSIAHRVRGIELGVEEYLTKPIYIKEIITRIKILFEKLDKESIGGQDARARFTGDLADMGVVDLIQSLEVARKSGVVNFERDDGETGVIYARDGRIVDAEVGHLHGERAVYRLLVWSRGSFEITFGPVDREGVISLPTQNLLMEGMRRLDEWGRLLEQLPPLNTRFDVDDEEIASRLAEIPDEANEVLRALDGRRTLMQVIDKTDFGDLEALSFVSKLYFEGLIFDVETHHEEPTTSIPDVIPLPETPTTETKPEVDSFSLDDLPPAIGDLYTPEMGILFDESAPVPLEDEEKKKT